ncbi:MAG: S24 family peptidase [Betaproteobacteria bacterium]|nr:S24 family peptidase [Betaproteobacteria bacterium]
MSGSCQGAATLAATTPAPTPACSGAESFALRVLGDDMAPEFNEGEIIIIEPDGALKDGSYVLAQVAGEWIFRQLRRGGGGWALHALNPARTDLPVLPLPDLTAVRGVIIQKAVPGRRRLSKFYV